LPPVYSFRDEEEEGRQSNLQQQNVLSEAPRRHSMALCEVTRLWYSLLVLVVGLLILVTAEMFIKKEHRSAVSESTGSRTVLFLRTSQDWRGLQLNLSLLWKIAIHYKWIYSQSQVRFNVFISPWASCV